MKEPTWNERARHAIRDAINTLIAGDPKLRDDHDKLFRLVAKSYPFARKQAALAAWKTEIKYARAELADKLLPNESAINRPCPACRAKAGKPCRSVGEDDNLAADFMAAAGQAPLLRGNKAPGRIPAALKEAVMHEVRKDPNAPMVGIVARVS